MRARGVLAAEDAAVLHLAPPVTPSKIARLRALAESPTTGIRQSVASNRHAPADLLETLAGDRDPAVRAEVARNETTPVGLLQRLAGDADARVRCWAVLNPGLPDADPSVMFERFWRSEGGRVRGRDGAGLGLAIVAGIVDAHGGSVAARNADGGGASFVVTLPARSS